MRALVVVCRYLGDVLLATPLARALQHAGYDVDWLVAPGTGAIIEGQPFANRIHTLNPDWKGTRRAITATRGQYNVACVINGADRPMLVSLLAARQVYALVPARAQDAWKRWLSTAWMSNTAEDHMVHYAQDLATMAGVIPSSQVGLEWSEADAKRVAEALDPGFGRPFVHLHPFARWRYKYWPDHHWRELAGRILGYGLNIVVTAGPAERAQAERLMDGLDGSRIRILAGELSWPQLACLTNEAAVYVGLDTANTHLAASTGTPTIALFGPTDPARWGPWPHDFTGRSPYHPYQPEGTQRVGNVSLLQGDESCIPCQLEGCERNPESASRCLDSMATERVWQELLNRLEETH